MNTKNIILWTSGLILGFLLSAIIIIAIAYFTGFLTVKSV